MIYSYEKKGDKDFASCYLVLAKEIVQSMLLNKNRYFKYNFKNNGTKIHYQHKERNKIVKTGIDKILSALLKII